MRTNIRYSFVTALAAVAITTASAAAAPPVWFDGADRNEDGRVSWSEYARNRSAFEVLDENGDGLITRSEEFGSRPVSSWVQVASLDLNGSGAVTYQEYRSQLRAVFDAADLDADGALSAVEAERDALARARVDRPGGRRGSGARGFGPAASR